MAPRSACGERFNYSSMPTKAYLCGGNCTDMPLLSRTRRALYAAVRQVCPDWSDALLEQDVKALMKGARVKKNILGRSRCFSQ